MSNIPVPMIHGANESEKIQNIISYITRLADTLSRELNSIGLENLSQELSEKIKSAISQHQDLSAYATKAYVEKTDKSTREWVESNFYTARETRDYINGALVGYATKQYVDDAVIGFITESELKRILKNDYGLT